MKTGKIIIIMLMAIPALLSAWPNYSTVGTPNFDVYYRNGWEVEAQNILQALEFSRPYVESLTGNNPGKIPVVLSDMGNMVNGYASPVGTRMGLYAYPPSGDELGLGEDWWQLVGVHEYIHMSQMTKVSGEPAVLRALFGNILYPNLYQPMWMTEGITVYGESQLSKYTGRLNSGTYPAIIGALAREGRLPGPGKACYYSYSEPMAHYYVYGSSFHKYLSDTYGEDKFALLYEHTSSSLANYLNPITPSLSLDQAYIAAFGKRVSQLWTDWQADAFLDSAPLPTQKITDDGWTKENLRMHDGALYYISRKTDKTGPSSTFSSYRLMRLENPSGKARLSTLVEQGGDFTAGFQIADNMLYYSRGEMKSGYDNNDYNGLGVITEVWEQNLGGGGRRKLFEGPVRAFCKLGEDRFLVSEDDATHQNSIIYEIIPSTGEKSLLGELAYLVGGLANSDGKVYATARKFWSNNSIYELDRASMKLKPLVDTPNMESIVAVQGDDLVYNGVYGGKNSTCVYKLSNGKIMQFSGFSEIKDAIAAGPDQTYFLSINSDGYDVYRDPLRLKEFSLPVELAERPPYERIESGRDNLIAGRYPVQKGSYLKNIGHMLWPRLYRMPYIGVSGNADPADSLITLDQLILGAQIAGSDVVGDFPMWYATVLYDLGKKHWGYQVGLENNFFSPIKHVVEYTDLGEGRSLSSVQYVPLLQRLNYGLTSLNAGFGFTTGSNLNRKLWYPFVEMGFSGPGVRLQTENTLMLETTDFLPSDRNRLGWQGRFNLRLKAPLSTELRSNIVAAWDPDADTDEVFPRMRGYDSDWLQTSGALISNSWYAPILKIRNGIWNPNIYIEDINLGLFYDYALPGDGNANSTRFSYGGELIAELFAFYNYGMNLGVRLSYNKESKDPTLSLILGL